MTWLLDERHSYEMVSGLDHGVGYPSNLFARLKRLTLRCPEASRTLVPILSGRKWPMR
jgi:hypothetical protein